MIKVALVASQKKCNRIFHNDDFWWLFGGTGGFIRYQIIELLLQKSYNACQMTKKLNVSYNNIRYHLDVLKKFKLVFSNDKKYGESYSITKNFDYHLFKKLTNFFIKNNMFPIPRSHLKHLIKKIIT